MKTIRLFLLIISATVFAVACKKDKEELPAFDLSNTTWTDSANIATVPYKPFTLVFNGDGKAIIRFQGYDDFEGYWNKLPNSNVVNFYFDETNTISWQGQGTISDNNTRIEGSLTRVTPSGLTGYFRVKKQ